MTMIMMIGSGESVSVCEDGYAARMIEQGLAVPFTPPEKSEQREEVKKETDEEPAPVKRTSKKKA